MLAASLDMPPPPAVEGSPEPRASCVGGAGPAGLPGKLPKEMLEASQERERSAGASEQGGPGAAPATALLVCWRVVGGGNDN